MSLTLAIEMRCTIDSHGGFISVERDGETRDVPLYSTEGFELLSELWLKVGWNQKHVYTFTWLDRPIIQLPEDLLRVQEVICKVQPDVIVESGVAHGGALIFYASLCRLLGRGRVVGVDIEIRPHNRRALEEHPLFDLITLVEGNSVAPEIVAKVKDQIRPGETVLVMLDSLHTRQHVVDELEAYAELVTPDSYVIVMDGIMELVAETPRGTPSWRDDNPISAAEEFVARNPEFVIEQPRWAFNESDLRSNITHWPRGYVRRAAGA